MVAEIWLVRLLKQMDAFGAPIPTFNLRGKKSVETAVGGIMTLLVGFLITFFALIKLQLMLQRNDTTIVKTIVEDEYTASNRYVPYEEGFTMAFGLQSWKTRANLDDPRYIKWVARYFVEVDQVKSTKLFLLHHCTEKDFEKFYTPDKRFKPEIDQFK